MKRFFLLFILVTFYNCGFSQSLTNTDSSDSLQITLLFPKFIKTIESRNLRAFKNISRSNIVCDYCDEKSVTIGNIFTKQFKDFKNSKILSAYKTRGYSIYKENYEINKRKLYCVWIETYIQNELQKGHEGGSIGFQFIKVNDKFKFYGLTSVP